MPHIVKSFDVELGKLEEGLARMGGMAESQLTGAIQALEGRDSELAGRIMADDDKVDGYETFINEQAIKLLALRAPVADDLRMVLAALKVAGEIERIADLAANAAKRSLVLNQLPLVAPMRSLIRLGRLAQIMVKDVLDAHLGHDAERALALRDRDQELDDVYSALFREILTYMMEDPRTITSCTHLMFIAKNLERIGDHATNIAELTHYRVTGKTVLEARTKRDVSSFIGVGGDLPDPG
ncbi:phosphate transport system regulatory protein PhoU [Paramagnetospirillum kuznetsovii]|uniref:Phosphate-specific transport system accessory protein PhoU n=1 Tax=Paramagnetospirillum kuznetsovii TaxID=2053833 RepID=A0A364P3Z1_9PROT|nr:phosphate signaling complex protein PhoU [Paramagnetospirillum kuznetsovii]RAU23835.1 phosphate transport system regulatory protein PhoU [Paramagnetospirillum kuznetsovii]